MTDVPDTDALPLIDPADALARAGGRAGVARELFSLLRRSAPTAAEALRTAHAEGNLQRLHEAIHRLRGATMYCGVPRLRAQAAAAESLCAGGDMDRLATAVPQLLASLEAVACHRDPLDGSIAAEPVPPVVNSRG